MDDTLATKVATLLDEALPDAVVLEQLASDLRRTIGADGRASVLVDGVALVVPLDAPLMIIDKVLFKEAYESVFPTGCRVDVAVGDTDMDTPRVLDPTYCFARLFFDRECRCTRTEFLSTIYRHSDD